MGTESETPAAAPVAPEKPKDTRAPHLAAWFDAVNVDAKKAAVAAFPQLRAIFSEAQNY